MEYAFITFKEINFYNSFPSQILGSLYVRKSLIFDLAWSLSRVLPKRKTEPVPMALVDGTFNVWGKQIISST